MDQVIKDLGFGDEMKRLVGIKSSQMAHLAEIFPLGGSAECF